MSEKKLFEEIYVKNKKIGADRIRVDEMVDEK